MPPPPSTEAQPSPPQTAVAISPIDAAKKFLDHPKFQARLSASCPKALSPQNVTSVTLSAILQSKKLLECFATKQGQASVVQALLRCTQLGLVPNGRDAHLVPFKSKGVMTAVFVPDYKGLIQLAYNHPMVGAIWTGVVHQKDHWVYKQGLNRTLDHEEYDGNGDPGPIIAAYAVCEMANGRKTFKVVKDREINRSRAMSRFSGDADSIWNTSPEEMWAKTAVRLLCKMIPQSAELSGALAAEDEISASKGSTTTTIESARVPSLDDDDEPAQVEDNKDPDPIDVGPSKPEATKTLQQELTDLVLGAKHTFDSFMVVAIQNGWVHDTAEYGSFDELPDDLCKGLLKDGPSIKAVLVAVAKTSAK